MNKIVAITTAAAIPTIAPAMPADQSAQCDSAAAALARAEQVVDLLRTRYICEGWKIDEGAAEQALSYCRQYAADGSDPDEGRKAAMDFFYSHGVSLDWVFCGDIAGLICRVAKHSKRMDAIRDADLISLSEQYIEAEKRYVDLELRVSDIEEDARKTRRRPLPETLTWSQADTDLGLPDICETLSNSVALQSRPLAWDCELYVGKLRLKRWPTCEVIGEGDDLAYLSRLITPAPDARARADEIVAAFDKWKQHEEKMPRGYKKLARERNKADRAYMRIEKQICEMRAAGSAGMMAKVRCALEYRHWEMDDVTDGSSRLLALSILDDIQAIAGKA